MITWKKMRSPHSLVVGMLFLTPFMAQGGHDQTGPDTNRPTAPPSTSSLPWTPNNSSELKAVCTATFKPDKYGKLGVYVPQKKPNTIYEVFDSNINDTIFVMTDANGKVDPRPLGEDSIFPCSAAGIEGTACTYSTDRTGAVFKLANGSPAISISKLTPVYRPDFPTKFAWIKSNESPAQTTNPTPTPPPNTNPGPMPPPSTNGPAAGMQRVRSEIGEVDIPVGMEIKFVDRANNKVYFGPITAASNPSPPPPLAYQPPPSNPPYIPPPRYVPPPRVFQPQSSIPCRT